MSKESTTWVSDRMGVDLTLVRWGEVGTPVLIFPTAGFSPGRRVRDDLGDHRIELHADGAAGFDTGVESCVASRVPGGDNARCR